MARNVDKLLAGLLARGYRPAFCGADGASIGVNRGQARMNKAAGEAAPTWFLADHAGHPLKMARVSDGEHLVVRQYALEFCSHVPLTWLLKFPPDEWEVDDKNFIDVLQIRIDPPELPPSWIGKVG